MAVMGSLGASPSYGKRDCILSSSGFYPKFDNDDRNPELDIEAHALLVTRKYSGYLSSMVMYKCEVDGAVEYVVTSKKSSDPESPYVSHAKTMWEKSVSSECRESLYAQGVRTLWAETLCFFDQVHGARVQNEGLQLIAIGFDINGTCEYPAPYLRMIGACWVISRSSRHFVTNRRFSRKTMPDASCQNCRAEAQLSHGIDIFRIIEAVWRFVCV